MYSKVLITLWK